MPLQFFLILTYSESNFEFLIAKVALTTPIHKSDVCYLMISSVFPFLSYMHRAVLNELFHEGHLTEEQCLQIARTGHTWNENLGRFLSDKPVKVVQKASQVLAKHGCIGKDLKRECHLFSCVS